MDPASPQLAAADLVGGSCLTTWQSTTPSPTPCADEGVPCTATFACNTSSAAEASGRLINIENFVIYDSEQEEDDGAAPTLTSVATTADVGVHHHTESDDGDDGVLSENDTEPDEELDQAAAEVCCPALASFLPLPPRIYGVVRMRVRMPRSGNVRSLERAYVPNDI
jgi:hypothetical protein